MSRAIEKQLQPLGLDIARSYAALEKARAECDFKTVKRLRDAGKAIAEMLKTQRGAEAEARAAQTFAFDATVALGHMTTAIEKNGGGRPSKTPPPGGGVSKDQVLKGLGLTQQTASRYEQVSAIPDLELLGYIEFEREAGRAPTVKGALRHHKDLEIERKREKAIASAPKSDQAGTVKACRIEELDLPADSVDLVFTDPPYHDEHIELIPHLSRVAAKALKPGHLCLVYAGKMYLPQILAALAEQLTYVWQFVVFHPFSQTRCNSRAVFENYRPILVFRKPGPVPHASEQTWVQDVVRGRRDKEQHPWQQDEDAPRQYIEAYTQPGAVVLDPFSGGGTTAAVCKAIGRRFLCFDADPSAAKLTLARIRDVKEDSK